MSPASLICKRDQIRLYAASKVAAARGTLGDELADPIQRVLDDPLVIPAFKTALSCGGSQSARL